MGYLSINLQLQDKQISIIGGGAVAQRKTGNILPTGAILTIISPTITFELQKLREEGVIRHLSREYQPGDLAGSFMAIAATSDHSVNQAVAEEARSRGILSEIVDSPTSGNITSPAVIRQGDLSIAISTNNKAPALSAVIKRELADLFGPEYALSVKLLGDIREKLLTEGSASTYNNLFLNELAQQLPQLFAAGAKAEIIGLLQLRLGAGYSPALLESILEDPQ